MQRYRTYNIRNEDRFDPNDFPKVQAELDDLFLATKQAPMTNKQEIIISYLRDRVIPKESGDSNPELTRILAEGKVVTSHTQALFESCMSNMSFRKDLEGFIRENLTELA